MSKETMPRLTKEAIAKTQPAQKPWVGLTDDERNLISTSHAYVDMIIRAAEAKLKEKNGL